MSIEEQIAALEARIQQCVILAGGCTERAEHAAERAEHAAARAELATLGSQQAEVGSLVAAELATHAAEEAIIAAEEAIEEEEEVPEDAEEGQPEIPIPDGSADGQENPEREPGLQPKPIVIKVEEHHHRAEPTLFKPNRTRFARGRTH